MRKLQYIFSLIMLVGTISLTGCPDPLRPTPKIPEDTSFCKAGCDHLMTLIGRDGQPGCEEARPLVLPENQGVVSCEKFCTETQENGRAISPKCWLTLHNCEDIEPVCRQK